MLGASSAMSSEVGYEPLAVDVDVAEGLDDWAREARVVDELGQGGARVLGAADEALEGGRGSEELTPEQGGLPVREVVGQGVDVGDVLLTRDHLARRLEPGDRRQEVTADRRVAPEGRLVFFVERRAGMRALDEVQGEGDATELREQGSDLEAPGLLDLDLAAGMSDQLVETSRLVERDGVDQAEDLGQDLHAAVQRVLEQVTLGAQQAMLLDAVHHRREKGGRGTGLAEEAEDVTLVDGEDRRVEVGVAGQEDPHRARVLAGDP
ncbi:MAG: hypothetical protein AAF533_18365 [Acidobacteriota bacterium]